MATAGYISSGSYKSYESYFKSLLSNEKISPMDQFSYEVNRLVTFNSWPTHLKVRPPHLAKAGFFFRGRSDEVMCYECKVLLSNWSQKETIDIHEEHLNASPNCSMAQTHGNAITNVPLLTTYEAQQKGRPIPPVPKDGPMREIVEKYAMKLGQVTHDMNDVGGSFKSLPPGSRSGSYSLEMKQSSPAILQEPNRAFPQSNIHPSAKRDVVPGMESLPMLSSGINSENLYSSTISPMTSEGTGDAVLRLNDTSLYTHDDSALFRYKSEAERLKTFDGWPLETPVTPAALAKNGFYYLQEGDKVRCIFCHGMLRSWVPGDSVENEHRRHFPSCPFMQNLDVGNIPIQRATNTTIASKKTPTLDVLGVSTERPKNPQFGLVHKRLESFSNWPKSSIQKPTDLAEAGFFYNGSGKDDRVRCFFCDGGLQNWMSTDDPFKEHATWFPKCVYLKQLKGEDYVKQIQDQKKDKAIETSLPKDMVQEVKSMGFKPEAIHKAESGRIKRGEAQFKNVSDIVNAIISDQSKMERNTPSPTSAAGSETPTGKKKNKNKKKRKKKNNAENAPKGMSEEVKAADPMLQGEAARESTGEEEEDELQMVSVGDIQLTERQKKMAENLEEENQLLRDQRTCKVCMDKEVSLVFLPCGHLVCCTECGNNVTKCPICRDVIRGTIRIYLS